MLHFDGTGEMALLGSRYRVRRCHGSSTFIKCWSIKGIVFFQTAIFSCKKLQSLRKISAPTGALMLLGNLEISFYCCIAVSNAYLVEHFPPLQAPSRFEAAF